MSRPARHFKIGIDFDDVLIASADRTIELYNQLFDTVLTRDNWYNDPSIVAPWRVDTFAELVGRIVDIHASEAFADVAPLLGARDVLAGLKDAGHELVVITGRPEGLREPTLRLLKKHYDGIFEEGALYFTDYFSHAGERMSKGDIAVTLGLTHFVDDVVPHANDVAARGVKVILFSDDYPWNREGHLDASVVRASSWGEVRDIFA